MMASHQNDVRFTTEGTRAKQEVEQPTRCNRITGAIKHITVEPILVSVNLITSLMVVPVNQLMLEKACLINLNYSVAMCNGHFVEHLEELTYIETEAQAIVTPINAFSGPLAQGIPVLLLLFIGSWSDRNGVRKPCITIPLVGYTFSAVGVLFLSVYAMMDITIPVTVLLLTIFKAVTGGAYVLIFGATSYISDITTDKTRTFRIAMVTMCLKIATPVGTAVSGMLFVVIGYYGIGTIAVSFFLSSLAYALIRIKETNKYQVKKDCLMDFFDPKHAMETIRSCMKMRPNNGRLVLILLLVAHFLGVGPLIGEVLYLYSRVRYNWSEVKTSFYLAYTTTVYIIGLFLASWLFSRRLKLPDSLLGVLGCVCSILGSIWFVWSPTEVYYYWGPVINMFCLTKGLVVRSQITKLASRDELGKLLSLLALVEALETLIYVPVYSIVYAYTVKTFPGAFFLITCGLSMPPMAIFIWCYVRSRKMVETKEPIGKCSEDIDNGNVVPQPQTSNTNPLAHGAY